MSEDFITIREAIRLTGKADITIRRLIKHLIKQDDPEATHLIKQEQTGKNFIYKINKDFLLKKLKVSEPIQEIKEKKEPDKSDKSDTIKREQTETPNIIREVIKTLKDQIYIKDKQIDSLGNKIDNLIERDRETNILLKGLQDRVFMLEAPRSRDKQEKRGSGAKRHKVPHKAEKEPHEANTSVKQRIKTKPEDKPEIGTGQSQMFQKKRGFFSRLFKR